jgi:hypothetical protein
MGGSFIPGGFVRLFSTPCGTALLMGKMKKKLNPTSQEVPWSQHVLICVQIALRYRPEECIAERLAGKVFVFDLGYEEENRGYRAAIRLALRQMPDEVRLDWWERLHDQVFVNRRRAHDDWRLKQALRSCFEKLTHEAKAQWSREWREWRRRHGL